MATNERLKRYERALEDTLRAVDAAQQSGRISDMRMNLTHAAEYAAIVTALRK